MDTLDEAAVSDDGDAGGEETELARRHYSTGKLSAAQARTVNAWRAALMVPDPRRWNTEGGRPPASSSDCVAAAVVDMLDRVEIEHLEVARFAWEMREAQRIARDSKFPFSEHVSVYLPDSYADRLEQLLTDGHAAHKQLVDEFREEAKRRFPERGKGLERGMFVLAELGARGLPSKPYRLPAGTVVRMAIRRWARKSPAKVVDAAVAYGSEYHLQLHRARRDTGIAR